MDVLLRILLLPRTHHDRVKFYLYLVCLSRHHEVFASVVLCVYFGNHSVGLNFILKPHHSGALYNPHQIITKSIQRN